MNLSNVKTIAPLEIGKTYKARRGSKHTITEYVAGDPMPFKGAGENYNRCWTEEGRYWGDGYNHDLDLIAEVEC